MKGIDGGPHKRWSMWFNSTQREEPYPEPEWGSDHSAKAGFRKDTPRGAGMAVVSSCREMLG